ncbi:MAG: phage holin [Faecalibacterium sp.]|jgi:phi LC3 family holin|nr:phage holin [Faecalibacterium sp.]
MKINWKLRLMNKTTLSSLMAAVLSLAYILMGIFGFVPAITQSQLANWIAAALNVLVVMGVLADPTTEGFSDSARALAYDEPAASVVTENEN